jgi:hypothetical protein
MPPKRTAIEVLRRSPDKDNNMPPKRPVVKVQRPAVEIVRKSSAKRSANEMADVPVRLKIFLCCF